MFDRIAMKVSEDTLNMISEFTGVPTDVFGEGIYLFFTVINEDPLEFNVKFMSEDAVLSEVQNDSNIHILGL